MNDEILYNLLTKYYEYLYRNVLGYRKFSFKPTNDQIQLIGGFIDYLDNKVGVQSIGEDWVFNFMVYSFKERIDQNTIFKGTKIPLNWILGKKSYQNYEKKNENWLYFNSLFCIKYNLSNQCFSGLKSLKTDNFFEELRSKYIKDSYPIHLCYQTVSFDENSKFCVNCVNKEECKIINN